MTDCARVPAPRRLGQAIRLPSATLLVALHLLCALPARADQAGAAVAAPAVSAAVSAAAPPDALPYAEAVAARFPAPAARYELPVLAAGREGFTSNEELSAQLAGVAAAAAPGMRIERLQPGRSQAGVAIEALRFSRGPGRPAVLLVGQQHGDEPAGAEALIALSGQLARGELDAVLDRVDVVVLPRANPDGAGWGARVSANGIDINRDHLLLRTPEAQAIAALVQRWRPLVVVDAHEHTVVGRYLEKFNAVQRHDMLLQYAMAGNLPPALGGASEAWFRAPLLTALAAEGLSTEWYYTNPTSPGDLRLSMGGVQPDTGRNVNGLRHAVSLLLESRGVGIGRLHLARRIHSQVVAMRSVLRSAAAHANELLALQRAADAEVSALACSGRVAVLSTTTPTRRELLMLDPVTGADKPVQVDWASALQIRTLRERARPCGYWLAASESAAVAALQALGVRLQQLAAPTELEGEAWTPTALAELPRPDVRGSVADAGATIRRVEVALHALPLQAPAGSWFVPLAQPLANLVVAALEPDSQNSYYANRLIGDLAATRRVTAMPAMPAR